MTAVTFDTLKFAKTLRAANVPQEQAEGIAQAFADATGEQIATKVDLKELELSIRADLKGLELRLEATKSDILKWMFETIGFQTIVILGSVAAINHFVH